MRYIRENELTGNDHIALEKVRSAACDDNHKVQILNVASGSTVYGTPGISYNVYEGDDLKILGHLKGCMFTFIINSLCQEINDHYGKEFKVAYTDERWGGSYSAVAGERAIICLKW
jgi:hypothetical protein